MYAVGYIHTQPAEQQLASAANLPPVSAPLSPPPADAAQPPAAPTDTPTAGPAQVQIIPPTRTPSDPAAATAAQDSSAALVVTPGPAPSTPAPPTPAQPAATQAPAPVATQPPATAVPTPAPTPVPTPVPTPKPVASGYRDGTYQGLGSGRHGDIAVQVVISGGRITSVQITGCMTRYPCSWISSLPGQVVQKQSARVNYVSGATASSTAFIGAVANALASAL